MLNTTPLSNRLHIGIFGRMNVGKSTLINALTGQETAIVSETPGTTTDPVHKAMEIHDIGPVVLIDTGGIDDAGAVGAMRVEKAYQVLNKTDVAILVVDRTQGLGDYEEKFLAEVKKRAVTSLVAVNKSDAAGGDAGLAEALRERGLTVVETSALRNTGIEEMRAAVVKAAPDDYERTEILSDLLDPSDLVLIVAPLDIEAPKGRLKLAQVQTIRDTLDTNCMSMIVKENDLEKALANLKVRPKLVITESQVFGQVRRMVPAEIPMTSFSILYARYKGDLDVLVDGVRHIDRLKKGDRILIAEACTHHPVGEDVAREVLPRLLRAKFGTLDFTIDYVRGRDFPGDLSAYDLVIHCGGCMFNRREMMNRINRAKEHGVPVTNYGLTIAHCLGILDRVIEPFRMVKAA